MTLRWLHGLVDADVSIRLELEAVGVERAAVELLDDFDRRPQRWKVEGWVPVDRSPQSTGVMKRIASCSDVAITIENGKLRLTLPGGESLANAFARCWLERWDDFHDFTCKWERLRHPMAPGGEDLLKVNPTRADAETDEVHKLVTQFKQVILHGPPGTGKTRLARRVAAQILGCEAEGVDADRDDFKLVVFHPAYEYDQFIGGMVPGIENGHPSYQLCEGVFVALCEWSKREGKPAVVVIDEVNRGNLPRLLGELLFALEYRGSSVTLSYRKRPFVIPEQVYVIGTMNSSDRSIGHVDVAVRRRFGLHEVGPDPKVVEERWKNTDLAYGRQLAALLERLNRPTAAAHDDDLADLRIGHSYFLCDGDEVSADRAREIVRLKWRAQVVPLLREYRALTADSSRRDWEDLDLDGALAKVASKATPTL